MSRALFLNWRDVKHPKAGGAEYATMELAQGLIKKGWQVDWFASWSPGLVKREVVNGVNVLRAGNSFTVQRAARTYYQSCGRKYYDFVLDQSHGIPFFSPNWTHDPTMYMICEVTGEIAKYMLPWPLSSIYYRVEPHIIRYYSRVPALTISKSTHDEMRALGYKSPITVINCGIDVKPLDSLPKMKIKEQNLTVIFAARLVPLKRPNEAILMMKNVVKEYPKAMLWILGNGDRKYVDKLKQLVHESGLYSNVKFWGYVSIEKKHELMRRAHFVTITSVKEGWGLTVTEANAMGTVAVTYDIAGVRDSNINNKTGLLSVKNNPDSLAKRIVSLYKDPPKYQLLRIEALKRVKTLKWSHAQDVFVEAVNDCIKHYV